MSELPDKEELLKWRETYKKEVNDESLSEQRRMYAFSRLTDIAAALKEIEEKETSFLEKYLKSADYALVKEDMFIQHDY